MSKPRLVYYGKNKLINNFYLIISRLIVFYLNELSNCDHFASHCLVVLQWSCPKAFKRDSDRSDKLTSTSVGDG